MRACELNEILQGTKGEALSAKQIHYKGIGTDTRKDLTGQVFWALKGESFDAHDFLEKAVLAGAACLVVERLPDPVLAKSVTVVIVPDSLRALQDFANHVRRSWTDKKVIGITGSNGKTTSKEFCQQLVGSVFKVHSNKGSFNNHFGLPFNLLATPDDAQVVLAEMGMNHAHELTRLCEIAEPDVVVCTMVGQGHIEHFGSVDKIAEAKEEIYQHSPAAATRIYNLDNPWTRKMYDRAPKSGRVMTFAEKEKADVQIELVSQTMRSLKVRGIIQGVAGEAEVPVFGAQNVTNFRVAAAVGLSVGMTPAQIWKGLPLCRTSWGRNQFVETRSGAQILFDAYNANPDSMKALIQNLSGLKTAGQRIGVFGEMLELGPEASEAHEDLGELVGRAGFDVVYFFGPHANEFARGLKTAKFAKKSMNSDAYEVALASEVASMLNPEDLVLVKGSRGMKMERFVLLCEPTQFESKS